MLFNIIIFLLLIYGAYDGYHRGLAQEILRVVGFCLAYLFLYTLLEI
ncbi:hypothetical protein AKUH3B205J_05500 [Apilactobacillus kunkeei]|nr:hypothetical protein AKUH3B205J_05500 [Apilactobacillus kunkeei]